jgi:hypothetical protein
VGEESGGDWRLRRCEETGEWGLVGAWDLGVGSWELGSWDLGVGSGEWGLGTSGEWLPILYSWDCAECG